MTSSAAVVGRASGADIVTRIFGRLAAAEILPWRRTERAVKHGGEGTGAAVTETVRDARHGVSLSKPADSLGRKKFAIDKTGLAASRTFPAIQPAAQ